MLSSEVEKHCRNAISAVEKQIELAKVNLSFFNNYHDNIPGDDRDALCDTLTYLRDGMDKALREIEKGIFCY
jgi:hypothetical protein